MIRFTGTARKSGQRRSGVCASGAKITLLLSLIVAGTGCDDQVGQEWRQAAFSMYQSGVQTLHSELETNLINAIQDLGETDATAGTTPTGTGDASTEGTQTPGGN